MIMQTSRLRAHKLQVGNVVQDKSCGRGYMGCRCQCCSPRQDNRKHLYIRSILCIRGVDMISGSGYARSSVILVYRKYP